MRRGGNDPTVDARESRTIVGWLETVTLEGSDEPVPVTMLKREGTRVVARQSILATRTRSAYLCMRVTNWSSCRRSPTSACTPTTSQATLRVSCSESGRRGWESPARFTPEPCAGGSRTPERVFHVPSGETLEFAAGAITAELDHLDEMQEADATGTPRSFHPLGVVRRWRTRSATGALLARCREAARRSKQAPTAGQLQPAGPGRGGLGRARDKNSRVRACRRGRACRPCPTSGHQSGDRRLRKDGPHRSGTAVHREQEQGGQGDPGLRSRS